MRFIDYFNENYYELLGCYRQETFRKIFELLGDKELKIVETGTARTEGNWRMDGQSTVLFDKYIQMNGGSFTSIDNVKNNIKTAMKSTTKTKFICADSIETLSEFAKDTKFTEIDVLYLDSMTVDFKNICPSATHHLKELKAILPKLKKGTMIIVDDNDKHFKGEGGKGTYVKDYLIKLGHKLVVDGYQIAFIYNG